MSAEKLRKKRAPAVNRSKRAGLSFPVGRVARLLRKGRYATRVSDVAPVYLAACLEYLSAEVLEIAGNACRDHKRQRIIPRHIALAVRNDEELNRLMSRVTFASGGVRPNIHSALLPKKKGQTPDGEAKPVEAKKKKPASKPKKQASSEKAEKAPETKQPKKKTKREPATEKKPAVKLSDETVPAKEGEDEKKKEKEKENDDEKSSSMGDAKESASASEGEAPKPTSDKEKAGAKLKDKKKEAEEDVGADEDAPTQKLSSPGSDAAESSEREKPGKQSEASEKAAMEES